MRQLFLGRGAHDEAQQGMTEHYDYRTAYSELQSTFPIMSALSEGLVVLFCKSIDDVSDAQMLVVDREQ